MAHIEERATSEGCDAGVEAGAEGESIKIFVQYLPLSDGGV